MFNQKQIEELISSVIDKVKKQWPVKGYGYGKQKEGDFYPSYKIACEYSKRVKIHAEVGGFPEDLFLKRAPNMTDKEFAYLKANFKQTTLPVYVDYNSTLSLPFQDGNWGIKYNEDEEMFKTSNETLQDYIEKEINKYNSLESFIKFTVKHLKQVDPNGVIAVKPDKMYYVNDNSDTIDTSKLNTPQPYYYSSSQIVGKQTGEWYLILLHDRCMINNGGDKLEKIGYVFELYDENNIYRVEQVGKFTDFTFNVSIYFSHNEGVCPVIELKGIPQIVDNEVVWIPPFLYACDNLDLALTNAQYLNVSMANTCFPYLVMVGDPCTAEYSDPQTNQIISCIDGYYDLPNHTKIQCSHCGGSGLKDRVNQFGRLIVRSSDWKSDGDKGMAGNAMYYVAPATDTLEFTLKVIDRYTDTSRKILHLQTSNSQVKGAENITATGMSIDQKAKHTFVKPQSDQIFEVWEFTIDRIGWQRYADKYHKPEMSWPNTFDYNSEADYMIQIKAAQDMDAPPAIIHTMYYQYLHTLYFTERDRTNVFTLVIKADRLFALKQIDIATKLTRGLIDKWEAVLHDSIIPFIDDLKQADPKFFDKTIEEQIKAVQDYAKAKTTGIVPEGQSLRGNAINDILNPPA